jgi:membrane protease YdiL (CAAX protease family)
VATNAKAEPRLVESLRRNAFFRLGAMAACLMAWMIGFSSFAMPAVRAWGEASSFAGGSARVLGALAYVAGAIWLYRLLVQWIERRPAAAELARRPGVAHGLSGFGIGTFLFFSTVGLMWLGGWARPAGLGGAAYLIAAASASMMAAVGEEVLFRGLLFRIVERATGTSIALLVSALFFGLAHLANPEATLFSSLVIAIEAGLLLGLAYAATRSLWFPIGIHFAWNFTEGGIFGASGSGPAQHSLVKLAFSGPDWVTGGSLGLDNSIVAIALCVVLALAFALRARKRGRWEPVKLRFRLD